MQTTQETWRLVDWHPKIPIDKYEVSSTGRIRNRYTNKILKPCLNPAGYPVCQITSALNQEPCGRKSHGRVKEKFFSTLMWVPTAVARAFIPIPCGIDSKYASQLGVYHLDGDRNNNHVENLEWRIGFHEEKMTPIHERFQILMKIKQYETEKPSVIRDKIHDELGLDVSTIIIQSLVTYKKSGEIRSKQWKMFGITPPLQRLKQKDEKIRDVHTICKLLCKTNANVSRVREIMEESDSDIKWTHEAIYHILSKKTYVQISDKYFEYFCHGEFYPFMK